MTDPLQPASSPPSADEALEVLREIMNDKEENGSSRVAAAKTVLTYPEPKNEEERKREAEEREMSLAAARGLLADIAAAQLAGVCEPPAMAQDRPPEPADAEDETE